MSIEELFETDWCVFYEWLGDQMPTVTSHYFCTQSTNVEDALAKFAKHIAPARISEETDDEKGLVVWVDAAAQMPYDPKKFSPDDVTRIIADENDLEWEEAFRVHAYLLEHDPEELEPLDDVSGEGETIPVPNPDTVKDVLEAARASNTSGWPAQRSGKGLHSKPKTGGHVWLE